MSISSKMGKRRVNDLKAIVDDYLMRHRKSAQGHVAYLRDQRSLREAIEFAGHASIDGKRHSHQTRLKAVTLDRATSELQRNATNIQRCEDFDALFSLIKTVVGRIDGLGELYIYDTAQRLGAHLGIAPTRVYLHRGVRQGAAALGIDPSRESVSLSELPEPFRKLDANGAEDCLCIYKEDLRLLAEGHSLNSLKNRRGCGLSSDGTDC